MDNFDIFLYILLILGSIGWSVVKTLKKDEAERQAKKMHGRPVEAETYEEDDAALKKKAKTAPQPEKNNEYFSYETMSDRDFEQAFSENMEDSRHFTAATEASRSDMQLTMDEEEVYKGVVWSEILKRKY